MLTEKEFRACVALMRGSSLANMDAAEAASQIITAFVAAYRKQQADAEDSATDGDDTESPE